MLGFCFNFSVGWWWGGGGIHIHVLAILNRRTIIFFQMERVLQIKLVWLLLSILALYVMTPSGRKVTTSEREKRKNAINSGHLVP